MKIDVAGAPVIDKARARKSFSRAAETYDDVAVLQREIGERMLRRMDLVKMQPLKHTGPWIRHGHPNRATAEKVP